MDQSSSGLLKWNLKRRPPHNVWQESQLIDSSQEAQYRPVACSALICRS